jgi:polysaccharide pyruvyl transferase WcaK-like protein
MWSMKKLDLREIGPGGKCMSAAEIAKKAKRFSFRLANRLHCYIGKSNVFECEPILEVLQQTGLPVTFSPGKGGKEKALNEEEVFHLVNFVDALRRRPGIDDTEAGFYWRWKRDLLRGKHRKYRLKDMEALGLHPGDSLWEIVRKKVGRFFGGNSTNTRSPGALSPSAEKEKERAKADQQEAQLIADLFAAGKNASTSPSAADLPERLLICGWYGTETLGDKAILGGVIEVARTVRPDLKVDVASLEPYVSQMTLRQMPELALDRILNTDEALEAVKAGEYSVVAVGGGPLMSPIPWCTYLLQLFSEARQVGAKTVVAGCGVGPLFVEHRNAAIKHLLELADEVVVRDEDSATRSREALGVKRPIAAGLDPAFIWIQRHLPANLQRDPNQILLAVRDWPIQEFAADMKREDAERVKARYEAELIKMIAELRRLNPAVRILPFCMHKYTEGGDDRAFYRRLLKDFPEEYARIDNRHRTPVEDLRLIASSRSALAMRFHSVVFSLATHTPFHALDYTRGGKIQGLIKDVGAGDLVTTIDHFDGVQMAARLLSAQFPPVPIQEKVAQTEAHLSKAFHLAFSKSMD